MLSVNLFRDSQEVFDFQFVNKLNQETIVVCPSPKEADVFRSKLPNSINVNVITISKFVNDLKAQLSQEWQVKRKSDLIFTLSTIWKMKSSNPSYEVFMQAFNLFTEFRSYTLDVTLVDEILNKLDEELALMIRFFWAYMDQEEIIDEQKSYSLLVTKLREPDLKIIEKNIIFWSFSHLNALQLDLIQSLAISQDVYIPFPEDVFKKTNRQDWIRWIRPEKLKDENENKSTSFKVSTFPKGRLARYLSAKIESNEPIKKIVVGQKNPEIEMLCEIPTSKMGFRAKADIFTGELEKNFDFIKVFRHSNESTLELIEAIKNKNREDIVNQNFKALTVNKIVVDLLKEFSELSSLNESFTQFDYQILKEVSKLDLPRTYFIPISFSEENIQVAGLEDLSEEDNDVVLVVNSEQNSLKSGGQKFNAEVTGILAGLGPVRRKELEFLETKRKIQSLSRKNKLHVFIEEGLVKHDLAWSEVFNGLEEKEEILYDLPESVPVSDFFDGKLVNGKIPTKFSATSLQSYLDCPRKFYFEYVERIRQDIEISNELLPFEMGQIEHAVIGDYYKKNEEHNLESLTDVATQSLEKYLKENRKTIKENDFQKALIEIVNYSSSALGELYKLKKAFPKMIYSFEEDLGRFGNFKGSIDFYAETSLGIIIIDFKRSAGSIPSATDLKEFNKIQLWFYINEALKGENKNLLFAGYMNLSSIEDSQYMISEKNIVGKLIDEDFGQGSLKEMRGFDFAESHEKFKDFLNELLNNVKNEKHFKALPLNDKVCDYCVVNKVCPRRSV